MMSLLEPNPTVTEGASAHVKNSAVSMPVAKILFHQSIKTIVCKVKTRVLPSVDLELWKWRTSKGAKDAGKFCLWTL